MMEKRFYESKTMWAATLLFLLALYRAYDGDYHSSAELLGEAGGLFGLRSALK